MLEPSRIVDLTPDFRRLRGITAGILYQPIIELGPLQPGVVPGFTIVGLVAQPHFRIDGRWSSRNQARAQLEAKRLSADTFLSLDLKLWYMAYEEVKGAIDKDDVSAWRRFLFLGSFARSFQELAHWLDAVELCHGRLTRDGRVRGVFEVPARGMKKTTLDLLEEACTRLPDLQLGLADVSRVQESWLRNAMFRFVSLKESKRAAIAVKSAAREQLLGDVRACRMSRATVIVDGLLPRELSVVQAWHESGQRYFRGDLFSIPLPADTFYLDSIQSSCSATVLWLGHGVPSKPPTSSTPETFTGPLSRLRLTTLLQMLSQDGQDALVHVTHGDTRGRIVMVGGAVQSVFLDASPDLELAPALSRLLELPDGTFLVEPLPPDARGEGPGHRVEQLLLEVTTATANLARAKHQKAEE